MMERMMMSLEMIRSIFYVEFMMIIYFMGNSKFRIVIAIFLSHKMVINLMFKCVFILKSSSETKWTSVEWYQHFWKYDVTAHNFLIFFKNFRVNIFVCQIELHILSLLLRCRETVICYVSHVSQEILINSKAPWFLKASLRFCYVPFA